MFSMRHAKLVLFVTIMLMGWALAENLLVLAFSDAEWNWRHLTAFLLYFPLVIIFIKQWKLAYLSTAIYCLLGLFNFLSIKPYFETQVIAFNLAGLELSSPAINIYGLAFLGMFLVLNIIPIVYYTSAYYRNKKMNIV